MDETQIIINISAKKPEPVKNHEQQLSDTPGEMKTGEELRVVHVINISNVCLPQHEIEDYARRMIFDLSRRIAH